MNFKLISDIPDWTIEEQLAKIDEEVTELKEAILEGDKEHIMEEILDVCQSALTATQVLKIDDKLYEGINKHNRKLGYRGLSLHNIKLPYRIGGRIYIITEENIFYEAILLGVEIDKHDLSLKNYIVLAQTYDREFVGCFKEIYTSEELEAVYEGR
ncbi:hypothetical protein [Clostridioides difficile]|jgi:NTP pyrophosphatase (non-canonical NTP hydrolase)|uniref:Uncharacterized protein n=3 Tax=root TaxID=1 RepID=Q24LD1_BPPCD|nr:hypothetical protein [Clostridioides difficile]YP_529618.1 hypothetical protein CDBPCV119_gp67 [Clostridium phage phi CD119]EQF60869.1 putative nucleotide pyrophosphohydrolase domain protein [Clostridioides difficile CD196]DAI87132.1 MAG TPA: NTP-PPase-like protein [Caudoviricetes sp.]AAX53444.1 hypothetical protein [Clostridium phage phi CD119]AJP10610.1 putative phage protein [Peptoclostridium phage p630P1] [Clostridioides difficile 630]ARE61837.1 putative phage protein [Peptoclostridium